MSVERAPITSGEVEIPTFGQRLGFQLVWVATGSWLRLSAGRTAYELPPSGPDVAVHQAAIIRVPSCVASSVVPVLEELHQHAPHHHYYPPDTMHVTVCKLGQFASNDPGGAARLGELRHIAASHPSFALTMRGLNLSPTTVFAQMFPHEQTFHSLRRHLGRVAKPIIDQSSSEKIIDDVARNLAHTNVGRFSDPVTREFIKEVSRFRWTHFGRWTVREVELVRTDKLLSQEGVQIMERIPLATV
jgi:2'-5' RNA ligase